ncbi:MAG TPA: DinB family protein [Vicinamibacterales bacterium]|nr:DinB family protein [Vicinamibacterales bacterium]
MTATLTKTPTPTGLPAATFNRILDEGYGPGAWYGSDFRAAVADVTASTAFTRPAKGRHNIAEVALHQAFWANEAASRLTGAPRAEFPLEGEDWFELADEKKLSWKTIVATLEASQQRLSQAVSEIASGARISPLGEADRFDLVVGITGHAAYHAGQIQLIKKLI